MSKLAIVAAILPAAWWWTNLSLLRLQYLNQVRMRSIISVPTANIRARPALFDSASAPCERARFQD
jgi:hypothetical protein